MQLQLGGQYRVPICYEWQMKKEKVGLAYNNNNNNNNNIYLLQLGWRPVAVVIYMYTNMNEGTNLIKTRGGRCFVQRTYAYYLPSPHQIFPVKASRMLSKFSWFILYRI
jgi:hypothetical protein